MVKLTSTLLIIFSALMTGLAQHPLHLGWLTWFSIIPFIFVLNKLKRLKDFLKIGF
ncbi:uncharacterized protein METZ01_LOCUS430274, partial [marine metagenome]